MATSATRSSGHKVPLLAHLYVRPANSRLVAFAIAARMFNSRISRRAVAEHVGVTPSAVTQMLNRCTDRLPFSGLIHRTAAFLDRPEVLEGDQATTLLEVYVENRLLGTKDFTSDVPRRWLWQRSVEGVSADIDVCIDGMSLLRVVADYEASKPQEREAFAQKHLADDVERVLTQLMNIACSESSQQIRSEMIIAKLAALLPSTVFPMLASRILEDPDAYILKRVSRHVQRYLRNPEEIPQLAAIGADGRGVADDAHLRDEIWAHLEILMCHGDATDVYPARSLTLASVRQYALQASNPGENRRACMRWIQAAIADSERPVRERMYAAHVAAELVHRYDDRYDRYAATTYATEDIRRDSDECLAALRQCASEDLGLQYALDVTSWIRSLPLHEFMPGDAGGLDRDHTFLVGGKDVATMVRSHVDRRLATKGAGGLGLAPDLLGSVRRLIECSVLTLDGVRRRTCIETLAASGFATSVLPLYRDLSSDVELPRFIRETATFCLAYLRHPDAEIYLFALADTSQTQEPIDSTIRHAALMGLSEMPLEDAHKVQERSVRIERIVDLELGAGRSLAVLRASCRALDRIGVTGKNLSDIERSLRWARCIRDAAPVQADTICRHYLDRHVKRLEGAVEPIQPGWSWTNP